MSEEIENAAVNVPRAIFTTMILNGAMGWAMVIAAVFCLGDDIESVLVSIIWVLKIGHCDTLILPSEHPDRIPVHSNIL